MSHNQIQKQKKDPVWLQKNPPGSEATPLPKHGSNKRILTWQVDQNVDRTNTQMDRDLKSMIENMGWHLAPRSTFKASYKEV